MSLRKDMQGLMATEVQRFREELLTKEELERIENDVTAFCIIEIKKYCGEDVFERKQKELEEKGIRKGKTEVKLTKK